jgi:hypothetical protein
MCEGEWQHILVNMLLEAGRCIKTEEGISSEGYKSMSNDIGS